MATPSDHNRYVKAVVANTEGEIFDLDGYAAMGMDGPVGEPLTVDATIRLPYGSELMRLPDRRPLVFDLERERVECLRENPYAPGEPIFPVAGFNSPGYVATHVSAYAAPDRIGPLPLFSYGAVGWHGAGFRSAAVRVDWERRQDLRLMPQAEVSAGVAAMRERLPGNRLRKHLERCALEYGCPAGKNFFLQRYEAPLPTARRCNAGCLGCLSLQSGSDIPCSQERIDFTPTPDEIADVALVHIGAVDRSVVSFGQGCEGDPLLAADAVIPAIRRVRRATKRGTINLNTNGSRPDVIAAMIDAGLDSIRFSLNSVRPDCYRVYFRPNDYGFDDVLAGIDTALALGAFVSINYLNMPGVTDSPGEAADLLRFLDAHPIHMIQWRNLNFDPQLYRRAVADAGRDTDAPIGVRRLLTMVREAVPDIKFGYFNPPKEKFGPAFRRIRRRRH